MECVFCKILRRELPAEVVYENDKVVAILDINPIHYGHALVIPRGHYLDFLAIPESDLHAVLHAAQIVANGLVRALRLEGFNIFSNNGRIAGQSVFHFHMHVTPRYPDDEIRFVLKLKEYGPGAMADYGLRIRNIISEIQAQTGE